MGILRKMYAAAGQFLVGKMQINPSDIINVRAIQNSGNDKVGTVYKFVRES
jgi:hypothetical protein